MRRAAKIDTNQPKLVEQMRKIPGVTVAITSQLGKGYPDLTVGHKGQNYLFEVKDPEKPPSKRRLTEDEEQWHQCWTGSVHVVETIDDVIKILGL